MRRMAAIIVALVLPSVALAADFRLGGDPGLKCEMTMTGVIQSGDAVKFRKTLAVLIDDLSQGYEDDYYMTRLGPIGEPGMLRLCLDSPGGSIEEAIRIADTLVYGFRIREEIEPAVSTVPYNATVIPRAMGTAVPAGARCESACAVIFMAGGFFSDLAAQENIREVDRVLHVAGRLGFHAPKLEVPGGRYDEATVGKAFDLAVGTLGKLSQRLLGYRFPPRLFNHMASTPPEQMFYIETVEQAASWSIQLAGAPLIDTPSVGNLYRLCDNLVALSRTDISGEEQYSKEGIPSDIRAESLAFFVSTPGIGHDGWGGSGSAYEDGGSASPQATLVLDQAGCAVEYDVASGAAVISGLEPRQHGLQPYLGARLGWALYPGYLKLADLADLANAFPSGRVPGDTLLSAVSDELSGHCAQYDARGRLIDRGACTATLLSRQRADRRGHDDVLVTNWPDGETTTTRPGTVARPGDRHNGWEYIGGLDNAFSYGELGHRFTPPETLATIDSATGGCFHSLARGETRCFSFHAREDEVTRSSSTRWRR